MLQKSQSIDAAAVGSQHSAGDFPEELLRNSIDPLGSGYPQLISELSYGDSTSALCGRDMLVAL